VDGEGSFATDRDEEGVGLNTERTEEEHRDEEGLAGSPARGLKTGHYKSGADLKVGRYKSRTGLNDYDG
jgi:hypothetical protein